MHPLVNIAVTAARAAGNFILRHSERVESLNVQTKGASDFVSEVDRGAEAEIIRTIRRYYPDHAILAEEGGGSEVHPDDAEYTWIIDPLDGTTNFLHRVPQYCVSIGIVRRGVVEHGVIYAPEPGDLYTASKGSGAQLNNRRLRCSRTKTLDEALIGTGMPIRNPERREIYMPMLGNVLDSTAGIRRPGSAALDLAYVAAGRFDGFWELGLKPWDIAAGILMVQEAGGVVSELYGRDDVLATGNVVAANVKLHGPLLSLLRSDAA
ncbi:MAG: inositol monophosphatase family protein [Pseudomonadota bacterium]|nr:inositol monophosphatase [Gammaproteobacteria bacterium]MEC9358329.1 inositol monophosphatase family protein [Pseudomonadota bacterium]